MCLSTFSYYWITSSLQMQIKDRRVWKVSSVCFWSNTKMTNKVKSPFTLQTGSCFFFLHSRHDNVFQNSFPAFIKYAFSALQHITIAYFLYPNYVMPIHLIRHSQCLFKNIDTLILSLFSCVFDWRVVHLKGDGL